MPHAPRSDVAKHSGAIGFLTVVAHEQHGLFGGLLVLNPAGRPLEFHCTAPLKPNRAQEILFGPTLQAYLYGEQIAPALVAQAQGNLLAMLTDCPPMLAAREHLELPLALVFSPAETPTRAGGNADGAADRAAGGGERVMQLRFDEPHAQTTGPGWFRIGRHVLSTAPGFDDDQSLVASRLGAAAERLDLFEPFSRIREAIEEAGGRGQNAGGKE